MFSCNEKISEKQLLKMFVSSVFTGTIFVIPYLAARLFKESIVTGLLFFLVLGSLYLLFFYGMGAHYEIGENKWLLSLRVLRLTVRLAFYMVLAVAVLGEAQVPFMQGKGTDKFTNLLVLLLLLVGLYGANTTRRGSGYQNIKKELTDEEYLDIEKQGRIREMIFWMLFLPFVVMILFGLREVDYSVFLPHFTMPFGSFLIYGYLLLTFLLPAENYLYASSFVRKKGGRKIIFSALIVFALVLILTLFLLGIYGVDGAAEEEMVTIAIMRYIRLPFGVLERFDMLMVWFLMAGCFVLICETLYYAGYLLSRIFDRAKRIWLIVFVLAVSLLFVVVIPNYKEAVSVFIFYSAFFDVPISLILPIVEMVIVEKNRSRGKC